jgi:predicted phage terminase large subunit-like protein
MNRMKATATLIEETELGRALAQDLHCTGHLRAITLRPERDKLARLLAQAARFEAGQVHVPESAPWLAAYLNELLGFPNAAHDDQVDSTSPALNWLTARTVRDFGTAGRNCSRIRGSSAVSLSATRSDHARP